jgi:hypothetical protein
MGVSRMPSLWVGLCGRKVGESEGGWGTVLPCAFISHDAISASTKLSNAARPVSIFNTVEADYSVDQRVLEGAPSDRKLFFE